MTTPPPNIPPDPPYATPRRTGPYRSRRGLIFGVCRGLAEYFDMSVLGMRCLFVVAGFFTGFWPLILGYCLAAVVMRPAPAVPLQTEADAEFYNSYAASRSMALHRLQRTFENLDRRIQRMESIVTDKTYDWERRLDDEG